jgi:glycosyltransferase involved in cell wall biosynthesis
MCKRGSIEHIQGLQRKIYINFARTFPKRYITNSNFLKNELIETYRIKPHKIHVIRNSIDPKLSTLVLNPPRKTRNKMLQFVSVGNVKKTKNIDVIVRVMETLQEQGFMFKYVHIGEIRNLNIDEYKKNKQIQFLGSCTYSQTLKEIYNSDVFINFSKTEGSANALLEARCMGLPCILSDIPSNRELAKDEARYCKTEQDLMKAISKTLKTYSEVTHVKDRIKRGKKFMNQYNFQIGKELDYLSITKID